MGEIDLRREIEALGGTQVTYDVIDDSLTVYDVINQLVTRLKSLFRKILIWSNQRPTNQMPRNGSIQSNRPIRKSEMKPEVTNSTFQNFQNFTKNSISIQSRKSSDKPEINLKTNRK